MPTAQVRELRPADADACVQVIESLPEWFSYPGAIEAIRSALSEQSGFVVSGDTDEKIDGFVTTKVNFEESLEITYLAIRASARGRGLGTTLLSTVGRVAASRGHRVVCLLTLGPSAESVPYRETVAFYVARGFARVRECRLVEWGGAPALLMEASAADLATLR